MKSNENTEGVSVIICCYNSAARLSQTLRALSEQQFLTALRWEVILVDNASTDGTGEISKKIWEQLGSRTSLRVVTESQPGLANARKKGINEASYSFLLFCDDDNWLFPDYVQGVYDILVNDPAIAACGGRGIPVFETQKPYWFDDYAEAFALGSQELNTEAGKILNLYGAGMGIAKKAFTELENSSLTPLLKGREGKKLTSSEDTELTYAFVLRGYKLFFSDNLQFYHYLPGERLQLSYVKKLFISFGNDGPIRNLYYSFLTNRFLHKKIRNWNFHLFLSLFRLLKYSVRPPKKNSRLIYLKWNISYIKELFSIRGRYASIKNTITKIIPPDSPALHQNNISNSLQ